jgi:hypothetical protein
MFGYAIGRVDAISTILAKKQFSSSPKLSARIYHLQYRKRKAAERLSIAPVEFHSEAAADGGSVKGEFRGIPLFNCCFRKNQQVYQ